MHQSPRRGIWPPHGRAEAATIPKADYSQGSKTVKNNCDTSTSCNPGGAVESSNAVRATRGVLERSMFGVAGTPTISCSWPSCAAQSFQWVRSARFLASFARVVTFDKRGRDYPMEYPTRLRSNQFVKPSRNDGRYFAHLRRSRRRRGHRQASALSPHTGARSKGFLRVLSTWPPAASLRWDRRYAIATGLWRGGRVRGACRRGSQALSPPRPH
jgi:hypothetical protein